MEICIDMLFSEAKRGGLGDLQVIYCAVGVTGVRTPSGKATNGRVRWAKWARWQHRALGSCAGCDFCPTFCQVKSQRSLCLAVRLVGWLIDWLISSRRSLLCSFYCHIASGGLGTRWHLGVFGLISCRTVDQQISILYATLPAWEHVGWDSTVLADGQFFGLSG